MSEPQVRGGASAATAVVVAAFPGPLVVARAPLGRAAAVLPVAAAVLPVAAAVSPTSEAAVVAGLLGRETAAVRPAGREVSPVRQAARALVPAPARRAVRRVPARAMPPC